MAQKRIYDDILMSCQACGYTEIAGQDGFVTVYHFIKEELFACPKCGTVRLLDLDGKRRQLNATATSERNES